jgi:hypothetical protein
MSKSVYIYENENTIRVFDNELRDYDYSSDYWDKLYKKCKKLALQDAAEEAGKSYFEMIQKDIDETYILDRQIDIEHREASKIRRQNRKCRDNKKIIADWNKVYEICEKKKSTRDSEHDYELYRLKMRRIKY